MSDFVKKNDIRLLIPFSINAPELTTNRNIYQVFQSQDLQNDSYITHFLQRFSDCHTVIIDCNDTTSKKGNFTFPLRRRLETSKVFVLEIYFIFTVLFAHENKTPYAVIIYQMRLNTL